MPIVAIDLGGTNLAMALFTETGQLLSRETVELKGRKGAEVSILLIHRLQQYLSNNKEISSIGVAVPGIYSKQNGTVWAPNIPGWEKYPLLNELKSAAGKVPVIIDSDRACYILGEAGYGNARGCSNAIFLAVGTGIGAGIMCDGRVIHGAQDIAGAIGWMALDRPFRNEYINYGCFEYHASGEGIAKIAREKIKINEQSNYNGTLSGRRLNDITAHDIFDALQNDDPIAREVIAECISFWGMAVANLVSLFNPEKILFGGGIFGPAVPFLPAIKEEAARWAQPISMQQLSIEPSALGTDAGLYGAASLAQNNLIMKSLPDAL